MLQFLSIKNIYKWIFKRADRPSIHLRREALARELRSEGIQREKFQLNAYHLLIDKAKRWSREPLSKEGERAIHFASACPGFSELILESEELLERFFHFVLTCRLSADVFILYPFAADSIAESGLALRIGTVRPEALSVDSSGELTLLVEGRRERISDPKRLLSFRGGWILTVEEVIASFANKFREVGNLEFFYEGVVNWNSFKMGFWDAGKRDWQLIDFLNPCWWKELPPLAELHLSELKERYDLEVKHGEWIVALHATRGSRNLSYEETHAFLEVAIPNRWGVYQVFPFGKYGLHFPANLWEGLKLFTLTMPAGVMYPDENYYYLFRQHGIKAFPVDPEAGLQLIERVRFDILRGFAGQMAYQVETENCAKWSFETLQVAVKEELPNFYRMSLLDTEPGGPVSRLFSLIRRFPTSLHAYILTRLHLPIGAFRGMWIQERDRLKWASVTHHEFWETAEVFLPALLVKKKIEGFFEITEGRMDDVTTWTLSLLVRVAANLFQIEGDCYAPQHDFLSSELYLLRPSPPGTG